MREAYFIRVLQERLSEAARWKMTAGIYGTVKTSPLVR